MDVSGSKEVRYDLYCKKCEHDELPDCEEPCNECMSVPCREATHEPLNFICKREEVIEYAYERMG